MPVKKKIPKITAMTVNLTAEEVLALRVIHSHWAHSKGNVPFCDVMSDTFLRKIGGRMPYRFCHDDHPIGQQWYKTHDSCNLCGLYFPKENLHTTEDEERCCSGCHKIHFKS